MLRPGVRENYRVCRKIRLVAPLTSLQHRSLQQQAQVLQGFNEIRVFEDVIALDYDAGHLQIDDLLELIRQHQLALFDSRWQRLRLGWYRYQDGNVRDASRDTSSSSCSQSPLRHR